MQWWSLLALADLFVINRPYTLRTEDCRSDVVLEPGPTRRADGSAVGSAASSQTFRAGCPGTSSGRRLLSMELANHPSREASASQWRRAHNNYATPAPGQGLLGRFERKALRTRTDVALRFEPTTTAHGFTAETRDLGDPPLRTPHSVFYLPCTV